MNFSDLPWFCWPSDMRNIGHIFCRKSLNWDLSEFFLMVRLRLWAFGRKTIKIKCHFHNIISRVHTINMTRHCWCMVQLLFSPSRLQPSLLYSLKKTHSIALTQSLDVIFTSLRTGIYIIFLEFFHMGDLFLFLHLFIYSSHIHHYGLMNIYFILWVIIQYILLHKLFSLRLC